MEKRNGIIVVIITFLCILVVGLCVYFVVNDKLEESDASRFRNEYMELNDKINENGENYPNVTISDKNTINYLSQNEAVKFLKNGTGILYLGFATCPWCRSLIPVLTEVAEEKNETINYLDILDIRSTYALENGSLKKIKDGTKQYYEILKILDKKLDNFTLKDEAGNIYDTGEKRIYAPTVIALSKGEITYFHVGTVESQKSGYDKLNEEQINELKQIFEKLIASKNNN